jgi:hypothetical protein
MIKALIASTVLIIFCEPLATIAIGQLTASIKCSTAQKIKARNINSFDQFSVMSAVYLGTQTLQMQVWFESDPVQMDLLQWTLDLSTYQLKSSKLPTKQAFKLPCNRNCRSIVVDSSKDGKWQLVLSKSKLEDNLKVWLVSRSKIIKVIDDARLLTKWQWSNNARQFFFLAVAPYGSAVSAELVDVASTKVHSLNSLFSTAWVLDAALNETSNEVGLITQPLNAKADDGSERQNSFAIVRLDAKGKLELVQPGTASKNERIDWAPSKNSFVFAQGGFGSTNISLTEQKIDIEAPRLLATIERQLFDGESRRIFPSPNLKHLVIADGSGLRVYSCG